MIGPTDNLHYLLPFEKLNLYWDKYFLLSLFLAQLIISALPTSIHAFLFGVLFFDDKDRMIHPNSNIDYLHLSKKLNHFRLKLILGIPKS